MKEIGISKYGLPIIHLTHASYVIWGNSRFKIESLFVSARSLHSISIGNLPKSFFPFFFFCVQSRNLFMVIILKIHKPPEVIGLYKFSTHFAFNYQIEKHKIRILSCPMFVIEKTFKPLIKEISLTMMYQIRRRRDIADKIPCINSIIYLYSITRFKGVL